MTTGKNVRRRPVSGYFFVLYTGFLCTIQLPKQIAPSWHKIFCNNTGQVNVLLNYIETINAKPGPIISGAYSSRLARQW